MKIKLQKPVRGFFGEAKLFPNHALCRLPALWKMERERVKQFLQSFMQDALRLYCVTAWQHLHFCRCDSDEIWSHESSNIRNQTLNKQCWRTHERGLWGSEENRRQCRCWSSTGQRGQEYIPLNQANRGGCSAISCVPQWSSSGNRTLWCRKGSLAERRELS